MVHVPLVVERVCPWTADPLSAGEAVLAGVAPPPVGGPPALLRTPTSRPSLPPACPADPEVSSNPAHVVGLLPPANVGVPLMFGELAPDHRLCVFVVSDPDSTFGPDGEMLSVYDSPLVTRSPGLLPFISSVTLVHAWVVGSVAQPDGSAPPVCCTLWFITEPRS